MSRERKRSEKDEKDEKNHNEKGHDEKGGGIEEKWRRDPFSALFAGLIVILAGILWFLSAQDVIGSGEWWAYFLIGLGGIFIIERLVRYANPAYRRPMFGRMLLGVILICVGASNIYGIREWWPLIVVAIGLAVVLFGIQRSRRPLK